MKQKPDSKCIDCKYKRDCGGFHDRENRCPEWVINERRAIADKGAYSPIRS